MRVLFVTDFYHPYTGGVEIHVRTVAQSLADRGHEVAVATLPGPAGGRDRTTDGPVEIFTVHHTAERFGGGFENGNRRWAPPFPDPIAVKGLRDVIRRYEPDVIHGHDWLARSALPTLAKAGIPMVTSLHYYTRTCAKKTLWRDGAVCSGPALRDCLRCAGQHYGTARGAVVTLGLRLGSRLEDRRTDRWISVSEATKQGNGLEGHPDSVVVANPVAATSTASQDEPKPSPPSTIPDGPFLLFVGDIRPEKGLAVLADAVTLLRTKHHDHTPLVVVGERMNRTITLPTDTIETGPVDHRVVQELWSRATVGVVPSLWPEPFGLVAIEAMAAGCPLVASDIGGLSEILADDRGTLVAPGDAEALAGALAELLSDGDRRTRQAERALAAVDRYSVDNIVDQIEEQYRLAIRSRAR